MHMPKQRQGLAFFPLWIAISWANATLVHCQGFICISPTVLRPRIVLYRTIKPCNSHICVTARRFPVLDEPAPWRKCTPGWGCKPRVEPLINNGWKREDQRIINTGLAGNSWKSQLLIYHLKTTKEERSMDRNIQKWAGGMPAFGNFVTWTSKHRIWCGFLLLNTLSFCLDGTSTF